MNPSRETAFRVAGYKPAGERVRENFRTQEEAAGRKTELDIEAMNIVTTTSTRVKVTRLTDEQIKAAERVYGRIGNRSLDEIADYFLKNYHEPVKQMTVQADFALFIADREKQNRRPDTIRNLQGRVTLQDALGSFVSCGYSFC